MKPLRFYEHFACAYGTLWLILLACSIVTQEHINAGAFGAIGFPVIALVYAFIRLLLREPVVDGRAELLSEIVKLRAALEDKNQESG